MIQLFQSISLLLAQTAQQKTQTLVSLSLLLIMVCLFVLDIFAKNKFAGKTPLKKIVLYLSLIIFLVFILFIIFYR